MQQPQMVGFSIALMLSERQTSAAPGKSERIFPNGTTLRMTTVTSARAAV